MEYSASGLSPAQQAEGLIQAGWRLMEVRRFFQAADLFGRALSIAPHHAGALGAIAIANAELGKMAAAEQAAKAGIAASPGSAWNHYVLGWVLSSADKNRRAIKSLSTAISIDPRASRSWCVRAFCWYKLGDYVSAREDAEEAVRLAPESADALNALGLALFYGGARKKGLATMHRCRELHPADARTHANLGWCQSTAEDYEEAFFSFRRALELRPDSPEWVAPLINNGRQRLWWFRALRAISRNVLTLLVVMTGSAVAAVMLGVTADAAGLGDLGLWFVLSGLTLVASGLLALTLLRPLLGAAIACLDPELNRFTPSESKDAGIAAALLLGAQPLLLLFALALGSAGLAWLSVVTIPPMLAVVATQQPTKTRRWFEVAAAAALVLWLTVGVINDPLRVWTIGGVIAIGVVAMRLERLRRSLVPRGSGPSFH